MGWILFQIILKATLKIYFQHSSNTLYVALYLAIKIGNEDNQNTGKSFYTQWYYTQLLIVHADLNPAEIED